MRSHGNVLGALRGQARGLAPKTRQDARSRVEPNPFDLRTDNRLRALVDRVEAHALHLPMFNHQSRQPSGTSLRLL